MWQRGVRLIPGAADENVNQLVDRFFEARKMMESMARGGGMPGMPGMPGLPGAGGKRAGERQAFSCNGKGFVGGGGGKTFWS